jgi:hypothetical protein
VRLLVAVGTSAESWERDFEALAAEACLAYPHHARIVAAAGDHGPELWLSLGTEPEGLRLLSSLARGGRWPMLGASLQEMAWLNAAAEGEATDANLWAIEWATEGEDAEPVVLRVAEDDDLRWYCATRDLTRPGYTFLVGADLPREDLEARLAAHGARVRAMRRLFHSRLLR